MSTETRTTVTLPSLLGSILILCTMPMLVGSIVWNRIEPRDVALRPLLEGRSGIAILVVASLLLLWAIWIQVRYFRQQLRQT